jgi:hypothetical protein
MNGSNDTRLFGYKSAQACVEDILKSLEQVLLVDRDPKYRLQAIVNQLLNQPDIKKVLVGLQQSNWGWDNKTQRVIAGVVDRLKEAIGEHKDQRTKESRGLYQVLMNLVAPPPNSGLARAAARLFDLSSRRGLRAGSIRVAQQRVDAEGNGGTDSDQHCSFYLPGALKRRSDAIPEKLLRLCTDFWTQNTRPTANKPV